MSAPRKTIDLRLLAYFKTTAEVGNITRAAEALSVAQPTLSKAIQLLEHQLGVTLLERRAHGVDLTPIGERLLRHARLVVAQVNDAVADVDALRTGQGGRVKIGAGPSWVRRVLPDVVADVLAAHPTLRITVTGGFDERLLRSLVQGTLDFVVAERPLDSEREHLEYQSLTRDELVVCARRGHALATHGDVTLERALDSAWALPPLHTLARRKLDGRLISLGVSAPKVTTTSSSLSFLLSLVQRSDLLTYTTRSMLRTPEAHGLVALDLPELVSTREAGLIFRAARVPSPAVELLVARLREACLIDPCN